MRRAWAALAAGMAAKGRPTVWELRHRRRRAIDRGVALVTALGTAGRPAAEFWGAVAAGLRAAAALSPFRVGSEESPAGLIQGLWPERVLWNGSRLPVTLYAMARERGLSRRGEHEAEFLYRHGLLPTRDFPHLVRDGDVPGWRAQNAWHRAEWLAAAVRQAAPEG